MAAERLTDDLLVEILSRVPARSLCRFKCVSNHWLSLIDHPFHCKKLPQTLAGFFYTGTYKYEVPKSPLRLISAPGSRCPLIYPYLAFLPDHMGSVDVLDCCNGLLLCCRSDVGDQFRVSYIVCNPGTEQWTVLPEASQAGKVVRLGFDPAGSSHFHVFVLLEYLDMGFNLNIGAVDVYSSETGRWVRKEKRCTKEEIGLLDPEAATVFLNGCLHFHAYCSKQSSICIGAVDTQGETWTTFGIPQTPQNEVCVSRWRYLTGDGNLGFIQLSQGCLHYVSFQRVEGNDVVGLVVYVLQDYGSKEWVLKHSVETSYIFGATHVTDSRRLEIHHVDTRWMAIHPECNLIFFTAWNATTLMCYDMDRRQAKVICSLDSSLPRLPYVPLYAKLQSLHT